MKEKIERARKRFSLWEDGAHILVACSGGPDSLSLLHTLLANRDSFGITVSAAHFNHRYRNESDQDETFVQAFCRDHGVPFIVERLPVGYWEGRGGEGFETRARELRYRFLDSTVKQMGATHISTGHTANDSVETFLISLLRGAGIEGMSGIPPRRGNIVRPLIAVWREEIDAYCREHRLTPVHDSTNSTFTTLRNWVRGHLITELEEKSPGYQKRIYRTIEVMRDEMEVNDQMVQDLRDRSQLSADGERVILSQSPLRGVPRATLRHLIRSVVKSLGASLQEIGFAETDEIIDGISNGEAYERDLRGQIRVEKGVETIGFFKKG